MPDTVIEIMQRQLELEEATDALGQLPPGFYAMVSSYSQKLRRSSGQGMSDVVVHLAAVQEKMVRVMTREILTIRAKKASQLNSLRLLLPEERYVCSALKSYQERFDSFIEAVATGRPSLLARAKRDELERAVTVRFTKPVGELVGLDNRRYGPFESEDVASIPAASAEILLGAGSAEEVQAKG